MPRSKSINYDLLLQALMEAKSNNIAGGAGHLGRPESALAMNAYLGDQPLTNEQEREQGIIDNADRRFNENRTADKTIQDADAARRFGKRTGVMEQAPDTTEPTRTIRRFSNNQTPTDPDAAMTARQRAEIDPRVLAAEIGKGGLDESRDLSNQFKRIQIQGAQDKLDAAANGQKAAADTTRNTIRGIDELLVHPGFGAASGKFDVRRLTGASQSGADFQAKMNNVVASMVLPNLGALKGPMSDKDVLFLKQMGSILGDETISAPAKRAALEQAKSFLNSKLTEGGVTNDVPAAETQTPTVVEWERGPDGRPRRKR